MNTYIKSMCTTQHTHQKKTSHALSKVIKFEHDETNIIHTSALQLQRHKWVFFPAMSRLFLFTVLPFKKTQNVAL